jgi:pyridoxamine 5'-phosphate oxidase
VDRTHREAPHADYSERGLHEADLAPDPFSQFDRWMADAVAAGLTEPTAMVLATAGADGVPSARLVLLKGVVGEEMRFFTNLNSAKAADLAVNPAAALVFPWHDLHRQVRLTGRVRVLPADVADDYFASRPRGAQLSAWASDQSTVVASREALELAVEDQDRRHHEGPVARPPYWGGFGIRADSVEFWQGRPNRLHDRLRYRRVLAAPPAAEGHAGWIVERLAP